jgi:hypothetical protein
MVGKRAGEVKRRHHNATVAVAYTSIEPADEQRSVALRHTMVEVRIKPYAQQVAEKVRREELRKIYRRNQVFGLLIVAVAIVTYWLFNTNRAWIFPSGWWRP